MTIPSSLNSLGRHKIYGGELCQYFGHFTLGKSPERLGSNIAQRTDAGSESGHGLIVGSLSSIDRIIRAHRPINIFYFDSDACSGVDQRFRSIRSLPDMSQALFGESYKSNIGGHITSLAGVTNKKSQCQPAKDRKLNTGSTARVAPVLRSIDSSFDTSKRKHASKEAGLHGGGKRTNLLTGCQAV